ncbi:MAG: hypothetical protein Q9191_000717 [Dirinaria sp. TL-2023a]
MARSQNIHGQPAYSAKAPPSIGPKLGAMFESQFNVFQDLPEPPALCSILSTSSPGYDLSKAKPMFAEK